MTRNSWRRVGLLILLAACKSPDDEAALFPADAAVADVAGDVPDDAIGTPDTPDAVAQGTDALDADAPDTVVLDTVALDADAPDTVAADSDVAGDVPDVKSDDGEDATDAAVDIAEVAADTADVALDVAEVAADTTDVALDVAEVVADVPDGANDTAEVAVDADDAAADAADVAPDESIDDTDAAADAAPFVCSAGACEDNNACTADTCDPQVGCVHTNIAAVCDDGKICTTGDFCSGGVCVGATLNVCDDGDTCTTDTCTSIGGCVFLPYTGTCTTGDLCASGATCQSGTCSGAQPINCDDKNPCTTDSCSPFSGCAHGDLAGACDDGNLCTSGDTCGGGACVGSGTANCDDGNACTSDSCLPASGCSNLDNTLACDDGNSCSSNDACVGGACKGTGGPNCDDQNPCTVDGCDGVGGCKHTAIGDGAVCVNAYCGAGFWKSAGKCTGTVCGTPLLTVTCDDSNVCTTDTCNPTQGCLHADTNGSCDDANKCTSDDVCALGACKGSKIACTDGNLCTDDGCDPGTGCTHSDNTSSCTDSNACTSNDVCSSGACAGSPSVVCTASDQCHATGICDPGSGACSNPNTPDGLGCNDASVCTQSDTCQAGVCTGANPVVCTASDQCHVASACDPSTGCSNPSATDGTSCNDAVPCTINDVCTNGSCAGAVNTCSDGNACTSDVCNPGTGACGSTFCTDNDVCTADVCVTGTGCVFTSVGAQMAYVKASSVANGAQLGASVAIDGDTLVVGGIADAVGGGVYVFVRKSGAWSQQAHLTASNAEWNDNFGSAVAISGDTIVVGAMQEASGATGVDGDQADNSKSNSGAAYVFVRAGSIWSQQAYLKASNTELGDHFGASVGVSGDAVVVGAFREASNAKGVGGDQTDNSLYAAGAAYVFSRVNGTWSQQAYLKASNTDTQQQFGSTVAIASDTIIVGAWGESGGASGVNGDQAKPGKSQSGAAYIFARVNKVWSQQAYLKPSNPVFAGQFGYAVAIALDTVVVGGVGDQSNATGINGDQADVSKPGAGAAYVFARFGAVWSQQAYLKASNPDADDKFGAAVAISGGTAVVGAFHEASNGKGVNGNQADNSSPYAGAAYVFARAGGAWSQLAYLKASNTDGGDSFGTTVAVFGDTVVGGSPWEAGGTAGLNGDQSSNALNGAGAAYVFELNQGCDDGNACTLDACGANACSHTNVAAATPCDDNNLCTLGEACAVGLCAGGTLTTCTDGNACTIDSCDGNGGCLYSACSDGDVCTVDACVTGVGCVYASLGAQEAYVKAGAPAVNGGFGGAVAVDGDTMAVGENGQLKNSAVRVFVRKAGVWSQQAVIADPNPTELLNGGFGRALALSGDTLVIGNEYDSSTSTGVDGGQTCVPFGGGFQGCAPQTGAVYVFTRSGTTWSQQAFLKKSGNVQIGDTFGRSVAILGDTLVVGAPGESGGGAAYLFGRVGSTWGQTYGFGTDSTKPGDRLGSAVAVGVDTVVVGADSETGFATGVNGNSLDFGTVQRGAAYIFARNGGKWRQEAYLKASNNDKATDWFGSSVALAGDTVVVGAPGESNDAVGVNGNQNAGKSDSGGAAYVFVRANTRWSQQAYLKASNAGTALSFGTSVAIAGDLLLVGATGERSNATGINGLQADTSLPYAGAAYAFGRAGATWSQLAYLKASNPTDYDYFGWAIAVSGNTVVAGAPYEDSSAAGVNGDQTDNGMTDSGAAYVFVLNRGCDDNNACTLDACAGNTCSHTPVTPDSNAKCASTSGCVCNPGFWGTGETCTCGGSVSTLTTAAGSESSCSYDYPVWGARGISPTSFLDNGDFTVSDGQTRLMWQQSPTGTPAWTSAQAYCDGLTFAGRDDWRLPTMAESESLLDYGLLASLDANVFSTPFVKIWTSVLSTNQGAATAWFVDTQDASWGQAPLASQLYARCVRTDASLPPPAARFTVNSGPASGTVRDNATALLWQQAVASSGYPWSATAEAGSAQAYCAALSLGGYASGWRVPTIRELFGLLERAPAYSAVAAIDATAFPDTPLAAFWSDSLALTAGQPWAAIFSVAIDGHATPAAEYRVRCVR